jgi:peptidoglycan/xylan/chitin deacetylase (PgdA/CDA1 family)
LLVIFIYMTRYYYRDILLGPPVDFYDDHHIEVGLYPRGYKAALVLTCDDITPDTNPEKIRNVMDIAERFGLKTVFFVIPFHQGRLMLSSESDVVEILKEAEGRGHEIAQHGLTHSSPTGRFFFRRYRELGRLPYSEQKRRIRKGKRIMEQAGFEIVGFRSPAFSASMDTLKVLDSEEFSYSSDTRITPFMFMSNKRFCESLYYPYHPKDLSLIDFTVNGDYFWGFSKLGQRNQNNLKRRFERFYDAGGVFVLLSHIEPVNSGRGLKVLEDFLKYVDNMSLWKPNLRELAEWWRAREMLYANTEIKDGTLRVTLDKGTELPLHDLAIRFKPQVTAKDYKILDVNGVLLKEGQISEGTVLVSL